MTSIKKMTSITFDADKEIESEAFRKFLHIFTEMGSTVGAIAILLALIGLSYFQEGIEPRDILYVFVPIYLFQLFLVELLKLILNKPRPKTHTHKNVFGLRITSGSFPSGHTANIFSLAYLVSLFYQLNIFFTLLIFAVAGAIAFSRVLLGRHFTIDIAAGAICGLTFSVIGAILLPELLKVIL